MSDPSVELARSRLRAAMALRKPADRSDVDWLGDLMLAKRVYASRLAKYEPKVNAGGANLGERRRYKLINMNIRRIDAILNRPLRALRIDMAAAPIGL